jgi:DNA-binding GntR family transcriptional regulator
MVVSKPLPTLKLTAARDTAADALRKALLEGRFVPGHGLSEVSLANQFGISRGPVREALLILAQEGLVTHQQNRGFSVIEFTDRDQQEIQKIRLPLESMALELAKPNISSDDLDLLRKYKDELIAAHRDERTDAMVPAELQFHRYIWEKSGNVWLCMTLRRVLVPFFTFAVALHMNRPDLSLELLERQHSLYIDYLADATEMSALGCVQVHVGG